MITLEQRLTKLYEHGWNAPNKEEGIRLGVVNTITEVKGWLKDVKALYKEASALDAFDDLISELLASEGESCENCSWFDTPDICCNPAQQKFKAKTDKYYRLEDFMACDKYDRVEGQT